MNYLTFLVVFVCLPTITLTILGYLINRQTEECLDWWFYHWKGVGILALIAFVWTTPWDNFLLAESIWSYPEERVLAKIGFVPVEEYAFFLLEPALIGAVLSLFPLRFKRLSSTWREPQWTLRFIAVIGFIGLFFISYRWLFITETRYLGLILCWFIPPLLIQWVFDSLILLKEIKTLLVMWILPAVYLGVIDAFAIQDGIWDIAEATTTGLELFCNLPVEEAVFFFTTSLLLVQGLMLWHSLPQLSKPK